MPAKRAHSLDAILRAVKGSGGVVSAIAARLGVQRSTVYSYAKKWAKVNEAIEEEREGLLDMAESVLFTNIRATHQTQQEAMKAGDFAAAVMESGDARWLLQVRRKELYSPRHEVTGAGGGPIQTEQMTKEERLERLRAIKDELDS
jgi:transposase-like protein